MADLPDKLKLVFPDWSDKDPPPILSLPEIIAICEKMLPLWNAERFQKPAPPGLDRQFALIDEERDEDSD